MNWFSVKIGFADLILLYNFKFIPLEIWKYEDNTSLQTYNLTGFMFNRKLQIYLQVRRSHLPFPF